MSRFRRAVHSVASGYVVLIANAAYSLVSWPLSMHYLSDKHFGLWGLITSIGLYLAQVDLGMSGSLARLLVDHKDNPRGGVYGSLIQTGWLVLTTQAAIITLAGWLLAPPLAVALKIEPALQPQFIWLLRWQAATLALSFFLSIFSHILNAHQRMDILNYKQMLALLLNLVLLWLFYKMGQGIFSLIWSGLISAFCTALVLVASCWRLNFFPPLGAWGRPSWKLFQEIFAYGKDLFLVLVGIQLMLASQTMIITARIGLVAAGIWYASTRAYNLVTQAVWRISDFSGPAFSEMIVRGESGLLRERYRALAMLTASFSGFAAVSYALCNSLFVTVVGDWTGHPITWPVFNDVLLGLWLITYSIQRCHNMFILVTKRVAFMRYLFFIEGSLYVLIAYLAAPWGGLPAIITCSILCNLLFSAAYGTWRVSHYFALPVAEVTSWLMPLARLLLLLVPFALMSWFLSKPLAAEPLARLLLHVLLCSSVGFYLFLRFGLSQSFQKELLQRAPRGVNPFLRWVFVGATPPT